MIVLDLTFSLSVCYIQVRYSNPKFEKGTYFFFSHSGFGRGHEHSVNISAASIDRSKCSYFCRLKNDLVQLLLIIIIQLSEFELFFLFKRE